jgi:hypothetical protein
MITVSVVTVLAACLWSVTHLKEDIFEVDLHTVESLGSVVLGAFAKFRQATISFVMSACLPVSPHGTTWLPLYGFS